MCSLFRLRWHAPPVSPLSCSLFTIINVHLFRRHAQAWDARPEVPIPEFENCDWCTLFPCNSNLQRLPLHCSCRLGAKHHHHLSLGFESPFCRRSSVPSPINMVAARRPDSINFLSSESCLRIKEACLWFACEMHDRGQYIREKQVRKRSILRSLH